jgi:hypothetical protein
VDTLADYGIPGCERLPVTATMGVDAGCERAVELTKFGLDLEGRRAPCADATPS